MRIGLLGAGRIGSFHAKSLASLADLSICDPVPGRAALLAQRVGASVVDDVFAARPDAVVIASATPTHASLVRRAIDAGIPVFCEKPIAASLAETRDVVDAAEKSGVPVMVGFQRRHDPSYVALRRRLRERALGHLYLVRMVVGDDRPPPPDYLLGSGGLFRDQSVHDFDVLRWLTGQEVVEVYATGGKLTGYPGFVEPDDVDTAATVLTLDGGAIATLTSSRHSARGYDVRLEVAGSRAVESVGGAGEGGFLIRFADAYTEEMRRFVALVEGGDNPCPPREALAALLVAEAATRSRRENRPVRVEAG